MQGSRSDAIVRVLVALNAGHSGQIRTVDKLPFLHPSNRRLETQKVSSIQGKALMFSLTRYVSKKGSVILDNGTKTTLVINDVCSKRIVNTYSFRLEVSRIRFLHHCRQFSVLILISEIAIDVSFASPSFTRKFDSEIASRTTSNDFSNNGIHSSPCQLGSIS